MKTFSLATYAALALSVAASLKQAEHGALKHRRHHARTLSNPSASIKRRASSSKKCKSKSSKSSSSSSSSGNTSASSSSTSNSSSRIAKGVFCPKGAIEVNGVCIGMLPDGGTDGGPRDTMAQLNSVISSTNKKHGHYGQYAQAHAGTLFDGSQLLQVMDDLKESGAIFQPAVMPIGGWTGLTPEDDSQARAICNVMKKFTDEGITVWLRFAHEVNWYQSDGTYQGNADDFKKGWAAVANACQEIAPDVLMWFTPNVGDPSAYDTYFPDDPSTVDLIGIDFYPTNNLDTAFLAAMKPFHDKYCNENTKFAIGETGVNLVASSQQKIAWINSIAQAKSQMEHLTGAAWFNYQKEQDFKLPDPNNSETTDAYIAWFNGQ